NCDRLLLLGRGILGCMFTARDCDGGELLRRSAVFMHMPLSHKCVEPRNMRAKWHLEFQRMRAKLGVGRNALPQPRTGEQIVGGDHQNSTASSRLHRPLRELKRITKGSAAGAQRIAQSLAE